MTSNEETSTNIQILITLAILGVIGIVGGMGNVLVIIVYKRKLHHDNTANFFIIVLAISDLIVCLLIVPCTMVIEYLAFKISSNFFCKSYYFLNTSNLLFSTMLMSAVALDRYLCICHPLRQYLTVNRAIKLIAFLALFSFANGILSTILVEIRPLNSTSHDPIMTNSTPFTIYDYFYKGNTKYLCDEIVHFNSTSENLKQFYRIVEKINHTIYIASIISVIILYSLIFKVVVKIRRKDVEKEEYLGNSENHEINDTTTMTIESAVTAETIMTKVKPRPRSRSAKSQKNYNRLANDLLKKKKSKQMKEKKKFRQNLISNAILQNMKSAAMLFVVALVYFIAFMPVLMIVTFKQVQFNVILYNLYYLNNAANPLIYCFMNSKFRKDLAAILFG